MSNMRVDNKFADVCGFSVGEIFIEFSSFSKTSKKPHSDAQCEEWQYHCTKLAPEIERRMNDERTDGRAALVGAKLR